MSRRTRVVVVDDHPVSRLGLVAIFGVDTRLEVVGEGESVAAAVELFGALRPEVCVLDLRLPDGTGLDALARIRAIDAGARILILTGMEAEEQAYLAVNARVDGYLTKATPPAKLVEAVVAIGAGGRVWPPEILAQVAARSEEQDLTPRELDVLRLLVGGRSNREIGLALGVGVGTVRTHVSSILRKVGVDDRTEAATEAIRRGIVLT